MWRYVCLFILCPTVAVAQQASMQVTATAYTLRVQETTPHSPGIAAWGDRLTPGMKDIAVSRDLIELGITHGTKVTIDGLEGEYVVRDKMHKRWRRKIDIFMGHDVAAARRWGRRKVIIKWQPVHYP